MMYNLRIKDKNSGNIFYVDQEADTPEDAIKDAMIKLGKSKKGVHFIAARVSRKFAPRLQPMSKRA